MSLSFLAVVNTEKTGVAFFKKVDSCDVCPYRRGIPVLSDYVCGHEFADAEHRRIIYTQNKDSLKQTCPEIKYGKIDSQ